MKPVASTLTIWRKYWNQANKKDVYKTFLNKVPARDATSIYGWERSDNEHDFIPDWTHVHEKEDITVWRIETWYTNTCKIPFKLIRKEEYKKT